MRSFTEYAGLRPSIFARIVALAPALTRFRRTSGVWPMLYELSSKYNVYISQFGTNLVCFSAHRRCKSAKVVLSMISDTA